MFEHLDDESAPRPPELGANAARREARYRKNRKTSIVAASCLLTGALMTVAVRGNTPQQVNVANASANASTTTVAAAEQPTATTVAKSVTAPGTQVDPGPEPRQPGANNTPGSPTANPDPGTPDPGTTPSPPTGDDTTTPTTVDDEGIVEWLATSPVSVSESGNGVDLVFSLEIRNGTDEDRAYSIDWCDKIRRWKVDTATRTVTPDYANCQGEGGAEDFTVKAGKSFYRSQPVVIVGGSGAIPNGTWNFVMHDKFHVTLTITGSPR